MDSEEILAKQSLYKEMQGELERLAEKIQDFNKVLKQVETEFEDGNAISSELFERFMMVAQEYYTMDSSLKESLPNITEGASYKIEVQSADLKLKIEQLDEEVIKNSVIRYFELSAVDEDKTEELEMTKSDLRALLDQSEGIDVSTIRPYTSILQIVDNPDLDLPDELLDEVDDTFSKPFVRAVLRGKIVSDRTQMVTHHSQTLVSTPIAGHSQTLE